MFERIIATTRRPSIPREPLHSWQYGLREERHSTVDAIRQVRVLTVPMREQRRVMAVALNIVNIFNILL